MQSEKFTELLKNPHIQEVMDKYNSPYVKQITVDGINNTVLTLKPHMDLGKIGFSDKIKVEDLNVLAHGLDNKDDFMMFQALCSPKSKALLSTSYVNYGKGNTRLFRTQGFILDVLSSHIQAGYC